MIIASNLHIGSYFMQHSASEMSKPYSTRSVSNMETFNVFIQLAWLQIYKKHDRELVNNGRHFVYANYMVKKSEFRLGTGFFGFSIQILV